MVDSTLTILSAALPSHKGGMPPFFHLPAKSLSSAGLISEGSVPISSFGPMVQVSGRSVLSLKVMHGMPITVVSSVMFI